MASSALRLPLRRDPFTPMRRQTLDALKRSMRSLSATSAPTSQHMDALRVGYGMLYLHHCARAWKSSPEAMTSVSANWLQDALSIGLHSQESLQSLWPYLPTLGQEALAYNARKRYPQDH